MAKAKATKNPLARDFGDYMYHAAIESDKTLKDAVTEIINGIAELNKQGMLNNGIKSKADRKKTHAIRIRMEDALFDAMALAGITMVFTMPKRFKKLWLDCIDLDPSDVVPHKSKKGKTSKKKGGKK